MSFLVVGKGMFGAATARHLAAHGRVTLVGQACSDESGDRRQAFGAHHDEGRIIGGLSRDPLWADLVARTRTGLAELDPTLVVPCGVLRAGAEADLSPAPSLAASDLAAMFPRLRFGPGERVLYDADAGYFSPRRYVESATSGAQELGALVVTGTVRALRTSAAGVEAELETGERLRAGTAVVATGAFAAGCDLLGHPLALRAKSETYGLAELSDDQAAELGSMPCVVRAVAHPEVADLYLLPPIRYPDGRIYVKVGANTLIDRWLADPASVRAWYRDGDSRAPLPALREVFADLLPDAGVRSWHTRRCADAYSAHGRPYVGVLEPGRLVVALAGNGHSAQTADALGAIAAGLALTGRWTDPLPAQAFAPAPADAVWTGMTLLPDRPGYRAA